MNRARKPGRPQDDAGTFKTLQPGSATVSAVRLCLVSRSAKMVSIKLLDIQAPKSCYAPPLNLHAIHELAELGPIFAETFKTLCARGGGQYLKNEISSELTRYLADCDIRGA